MVTVTETVLNWSVASDMQAPHSLDEVLRLLNEARLSIPAEYRATTEIDFDPYFDCAGDNYPQVCVTYERPETTDETVERLTKERTHWGDQMKAATDRVAFCMAQIDALRDEGVGRMTYYLYDPGYDEYTAHATLEAAMRSGRELIDAYRDQCDPEWPEYVEGIAVYESDDPEAPKDGKMVGRSVMCDVVSRPDDVDEDGYSESTDKWFNEVDFWCDYKMEAR